MKYFIIFVSLFCLTACGPTLADYSDLKSDEILYFARVHHLDDVQLTKKENHNFSQKLGVDEWKTNSITICFEDGLGQEFCEERADYRIKLQDIEDSQDSLISFKTTSNEMKLTRIGFDTRKGDITYDFKVPPRIKAIGKQGDIQYMGDFIVMLSGDAKNPDLVPKLVLTAKNNIQKSTKMFVSETRFKGNMNIRHNAFKLNGLSYKATRKTLVRKQIYIPVYVP